MFANECVVVVDDDDVFVRIVSTPEENGRVEGGRRRARSVERREEKWKRRGVWSCEAGGCMQATTQKNRTGKKSHTKKAGGRKKSNSGSSRYRTIHRKIIVVSVEG